MASLTNGQSRSLNESETRLARVLCDINYALTSADEWQGRVAFVLDQMAYLLRLDLAALLLVSDQERLLVYVPSQKGGTLVPATKASVAEHYRLLTGDVPVLDTMEILPTGVFGEESYGAESDDSGNAVTARSYISLPLIGVDEMLGVIHIASSDPDVYDEEDLSVFSIIAAQLANYLAHLNLHQTLERYDRERDSAMAEMLHELKNPLSSVWGFIQMAMRRLAHSSDPDAVQGREMVKRAYAQLARVVEIADSTLDVTRVRAGWESLEREEVHLAALARRCAEAVQVTTNRHSIEVISEGACTVRGDEHRIEQVLQNLLSNAVKYSPEGGPVEVTVRSDEAQHVVRVAVRDHGVGMSSEQQSQLFQRYYRADTTTRRKVGGSGLGLYISSEIAPPRGPTGGGE